MQKKIFLGRQSGSLAWRLSRQETTKGFVIKPTNLEIEAKKIDISYDINGDKYVRLGTQIPKNALTYCPLVFGVPFSDKF